MKKTLLLVALGLLCFRSMGQPQPPSGTVTLVKVEPTYICRDDSFKVHFKFFFSGNPDTIVPHTFYFWRPPFSFNQFWTTPYYNFYGLTKNLVGSDTIYTFTAFCPITYTSGPAMVCINGQNSCINVQINICDHVGVPELLNTGQVPVYYDLFGNIIEPRKGEIIIEQVGNRRRKLVIQP